MRATALAVVVGVLGAAAQAQASPRRVAVVIDLAANVSPARATELGAALADALGRELALEAIGGADVERRLPPEGAPEECVASPACVAELAERLDATELLFVSLGQIGDAVQVDATWAPATGAAPVSRPRLEIAADARAGEVFAAAAPRLIPDAPRREVAVVMVPPAPRRHLTTTTWTLGGVSAAAAVGALALGLSARAGYVSCEADPARCDDAKRDSIGTRALAADALAAAALIGAGVTAYLYVRSGRRSEPAVRAAIAPLPTGAIADVRIDF